MPGYARYAEMAPKIARSVTRGELRAEWAEDGKSFTYSRDGKRYSYDVGRKTATEVQGEEGPANRFAGRRGGPARGRQATEALSPDSSLRAFYRDRNLWLSNADSTGERPLTSDGSAERRIKYGTASWVYGEELRQTTAMWWSPDGTKLAYYRFDEGPVQDYFLQMDQTELYGEVMTEAYPKAGTDNPVVDLFVYDVASGKTTQVDVRDGTPSADDVVGYYVYNVRWSPDGSELLFNRTNRRQNIMEFTACAPGTGACRVIVREEWPASWTDNSPTIQWLEDGKRFIWESERTGFQNYYLYDISGKLLATLTNHPFEVAGIVRVDEKAKQLWYYARSGDNYMKLQLHRVGLDGKNDRRLTDPAFLHTVTIAPDGKHIIDVAQTHDTPPVTRLLDQNGRVLATLAESDDSEARALGVRPVELFTYTSADGETELHGMLHFPSNFDPNRKYPVLFSVYGGPATNGASERYTTPNPMTEYGFLVVTLDTRSAAGRGKRFLDAIYQNLGGPEIDDMAAASLTLAKRPYVDGERVGIFGTSYGGYASALALLRHPEAFAAASASSPVTSWYHYDTIYTERYMWTPQGNKAGYEHGDAMKYAKDLDGRLMLYYGTADDNVHPSNMMQLIKSLQQAGKSFDVQVGPDAGHSGLNGQRMMEFFIENLVMQPLKMAS
ncbi:MAG: DPP IV N-terminal domain-containing protein [Gemmatimonadales bacterium]|nr:DPP IV N-terminal domain-containing protein [Gemmatimonadales bacterium]